MNDSAKARLQRLLGGDVLAAVRLRLRRHFERAEAGAAVNRLQLTGLDPTAHAALCQLTGRPSRAARSMTLDLAELGVRLREAGLADSVQDALERLEGPIAAKAALRRERIARWAALVAADAADSRLRAWRDAPAALTLLKRLGREPDRAAGLLEAADAVLRRLPAAGTTRSQLAAEALGDAHGLDAGMPVATIVLAVLRHTASEQRDAPPAAGVREDDERARDVWARAGVLVNELARPALMLNLPAGDDTASPWTPGEPAYLSLRYLLRRRSSWAAAGLVIHVCENPAVVAIAADRLGMRCAPLVCTDGMPAAAQRVLLDQLTRAGARLRYHGDFDWAGLGIGNFVMRSWCAEPWRFRAADYLLAVGRCAAARRHDLDTAAVEASWDPELGRVMHERGLAIAEEAVVQGLLEDLRS